MFLLELKPEEITLRPLSAVRRILFRRIADKKINLNDDSKRSFFLLLIGNFIKMDFAKENNSQILRSLEFCFHEELNHEISRRYIS